MKIIIPPSRVDVHMLPIFTDVLMHHGNLHGHKIAIYPTKSAVSAADVAASRLRSLCPSVEVHPMPDFEGGWPKEPNQFWASVAKHLHSVAGAARKLESSASRHGIAIKASKFMTFVHCLKAQRKRPSETSAFLRYRHRLQPSIQSNR